MPDALRAHGYIAALVYAPARGRRFLFANDENKHEYFVSHAVAGSVDHEEFDSWKVGQQLWILPSDYEESGKALRALDVQTAD